MNLLIATSEVLATLNYNRRLKTQILVNFAKFAAILPRWITNFDYDLSIAVQVLVMSGVSIFFLSRIAALNTWATKRQSDTRVGSEVLHGVSFVHLVLLSASD